MVDYKSVSWNAGDLVTRDKLTRMANNTDFLAEKMPVLRYTRTIVVDKGVKMIVGREIIAKQDSRFFQRQVNLGDFFTPGCSPIVTTNLISDSEWEVNLRAQGIGQVQPNSNVFIIYGVADKESGAQKGIEKQIYVDWMAVGY